MQRIMEILDKHKTILLSMMTLPPEREDDDWLVVLRLKGEEAKVRKAISIVESIKGEPALKGFKGTCEACTHTCTFAGTKAEDLPAWLID